MVIEYAGMNEDLSITTTEQDGIENSIKTIASTPYASAPFIRSMGIKNYPPKNNSELEKNKYAAEVITQCGIWEDRAKISAVHFTGDNDVRMVVIGNG